MARPGHGRLGSSTGGVWIVNDVGGSVIPVDEIVFQIHA